MLSFLRSLPPELPHALGSLRAVGRKHLRLHLAFRDALAPRLLLALRPFPVVSEPTRRLVQLHLALVGDFPAHGLSVAAGLLVVLMIEQQRGLDLNLPFEGMLVLEAGVFGMRVVVVPAAMRGADSAEGRAPRVAGLVELAHHSNKIIQQRSDIIRMRGRGRLAGRGACRRCRCA